MERLALKVAVLAILLFLTGCFALPVEDPVPASPVVAMPQARAVRTASVAYGDVVRYFNVRAFHVPTREERLSFSVAGLRIDGIYVDRGDYVQAGDIVASLYRPEIRSQYMAASRQEELLLLNLGQIERRRRLALAHAEILEEPADDTHYRSEDRRLRRELSILRAELDFLRREIEQLYLRATIDGIVSHARVYAEGMISDTLSSIAVISDQTYSVFEVRTPDVIPYMQTGGYFTIMVDQVPYEAVVVAHDELVLERGHLRGHEIFLVLLDEGAALYDVRTATIRVEVNAVQDVLLVPVRSVNRVGERFFVYILNEYGIREIRDIEVGLRGNTAYEILSGLDIGELVIID